MNFTFVILIIITGISLTFLLSWKPNKAGQFYSTHPMWFAHRGLLHTAPENTMAAYMAAAETDVPGLEMDVVCTCDGVIICSHNYDLERETDGSGYIFEKDYSYISNVNAAAKWPGRTDRMPTLESTLTKISSGIRVNIELKTRKVLDFKIALKTAAIVQRLGMVERVIISSFNPFSLGIIKLFYPAVLTGFIFESKLHFSLVHFARPDCLHPRADFVTDDLVCYARERKLAINAWTVNTRPAMEWLLRQGIDGLITDRPEFRHDDLILQISVSESN